MAFNVVVKHTFLDVEPSGGDVSPNRLRAQTDSGFAYSDPAKKQLPGHAGPPPGTFNTSGSMGAIDESEDDGTSTAAGSTAVRSPGWSDAGERSRFSTMDLAPVPEAHESVEAVGATFPSWADIADSVCSGERSRFSTMDLTPVPEAPESAESSPSAFPRQPPGVQLAQSAATYPPGMFEWGVAQAWPIPFGETKSWGAQSAPSSCPPGVHQGSYAYSWFGAPTAVPANSAGSSVKKTKSDPASQPASAASEVAPEGKKSKGSVSDVPEDQRTTLMLRNLPSDFSRDAAAEVLDREGFNARYDFVYMPTDFKNWAAFGYCFVNLVTPADALEAKEHFQGLSWPGESGKVCDVLWCGAQQGLEALIERFRSSPVMHSSVPDAVRPAVYKDGVRSNFPAPTKAIKMPRMRTVGE